MCTYCGLAAPPLEQRTALQKADVRRPIPDGPALPRRATVSQEAPDVTAIAGAGNQRSLREHRERRRELRHMDPQRRPDPDEMPKPLEPGPMSYTYARTCDGVLTWCRGLPPTISILTIGFRRLEELYNKPKLHWMSKARNMMDEEMRMACNRCGVSTFHGAMATDYFNCLHFGDPDKNTTHLGTHPRNLACIVRDREFLGILRIFGQKLDELIYQWEKHPGEGIQVSKVWAMWCRSGYHRSTSMGELAYFCLRKAGFKVDEPQNLCQEFFPEKCKGRGPCFWCRPVRLVGSPWYEEAKTSLLEAWRIWGELGLPRLAPDRRFL